jgi:hypothetical protein
MVFDSSFFTQQPGQILDEDRFRQVELGVGFRKITCYRCDFSSFYRFKVIQVRRSAELLPTAEEDVRPDHLEIWRNIPRFAEIPETLRCRNCNEVVGVYTSCLF